MRGYALAVALAVATSTSAQTVKTVIDNGPVSNRYDLVILGDGYQDFEEAKFDADVLRTVQHLFGKPAYAAYQSYFNVHTVFRASAESGADHPNANPPIYRDTVYDATYNFGGARCLNIQNIGQASADSLLAPDVEWSAMVVVNDPQYGGCGGSFSVSCNGAQGPEVQAHEFGHSFGGLADEYETGQAGTYSGPEPPQPNITADSTGMLKWPLWLGVQGVSTFEGAGYYRRGLWRPKLNCLMRYLPAPLCPVCNEQLVKQVYQAVDPIESASPASRSLTLQRPATQTFSITNLVPGASSIEWKVNGQLAASGTTSFTWDPGALPIAQYTITVTVTDLTPFVRNDPTKLLQSSASWTVDLLSVNPGTYTTFGTGCTGSYLLSCPAMNVSASHAGRVTWGNSTFAIEATAARDLTVGGFELLTSSQQPTSVPIAIELYTAAATGEPGTLVSTGSMLVGPSLGWYVGTFTTPYDMRAGETFYLAFTTPTDPISSSITSGTRIRYHYASGSGGPWFGPYHDPWAYRVTCVGETLGTPTLSATGRPEIGQSFDIDLGLAVANAPAGLLFGASNSSWGVVPLPFDFTPLGAPGCLLLSSGNAVIPLQANAAGAATITIALPPVPALVDAVFHNQFYVVDAAANALGIVWTNGGTAKIGL